MLSHYHHFLHVFFYHNQHHKDAQQIIHCHMSKILLMRLLAIILDDKKFTVNKESYTQIVFILVQVVGTKFDPIKQLPLFLSGFSSHTKLIIFVGIYNTDRDE
jgi:hypothetical protein